MVGRLLSFWDGLFSGAMSNFQQETIRNELVVSTHLDSLSRGEHKIYLKPPPEPRQKNIMVYYNPHITA